MLSHTEVDYGADVEETAEPVDEFADAIVIQDDAMDVDKTETETKDEAGNLDDVVVIEEPETGHPAVEVTTEESKAPETEGAAAGGDPVPVVDVEKGGATSPLLRLLPPMPTPPQLRGRSSPGGLPVMRKQRRHQRGPSQRQRRCH